MAASVPDTGGVYFVPAFGGLLAPWWQSDARGVIAGLTQYTTKVGWAAGVEQSIVLIERTRGGGCTKARARGHAGGAVAPAPPMPHLFVTSAKEAGPACLSRVLPPPPPPPPPQPPAPCRPSLINSLVLQAHIVRAMLEAVCFQTLDVLDAMQQDADCSELGAMFVDGGASQNNLLMQASGK